MPYRRHRQVGKSDKHEVEWSKLGINGSIGNATVLASTVDVGSKTTATENAVGSHVRGIFIEMNFSNQDASETVIVHWKVAVKAPNQTASLANVYYQDDRSYILKRGMEMLPAEPSTVFKRIIFVPIGKIYERRKQGDEIIISLVSTSTTLINWCGFAIYKERY